jgi:hypothetical protein
MAICAEWINRGYKDTMMERFINASSLLQITINPIYNYEKPRWIGNEALHKSHRARLHQKDPVHYAQFKADDEGQDYVWVTE